MEIYKSKACALIGQTLFFTLSFYAYILMISGFILWHAPSDVLCFLVTADMTGMLILASRKCMWTTCLPVWHIVNVKGTGKWWAQIECLLKAGLYIVRALKLLRAWNTCSAVMYLFIYSFFFLMSFQSCKSFQSCMSYVFQQVTNAHLAPLLLLKHNLMNHCSSDYMTCQITGHATYFKFGRLYLTRLKWCT